MRTRRLAVREVGALVREAAIGWFNDRAPRKGAALAFYTIFSLAPTLLIAINVAAVFFGEDAARGEVVAQIRGLVGDAGARAVESMIEAAAISEDTGWVAALGLLTMFVGATTALAELKDGLDQIWVVPPERTRGISYFIRSRMLSFGMILTLGFLLLVSLVFSAALSALARYLGPRSAGPELLEALNAVLSFGLVTALFAAIYKLLPSVRIAWRDVIAGAAVTAALFSVGKFVIGFYLGNSAVTSAYGAAGSVVLVLLWVYYSAQIFLLGAEFTKFYAYRYGSRRRKPEAVAVLETGGASAPARVLR